MKYSFIAEHIIEIMRCLIKSSVDSVHIFFPEVQKNFYRLPKVYSSSRSVFEKQIMCLCIYRQHEANGDSFIPTSAADIYIADGIDDFQFIEGLCGQTWDRTLANLARRRTILDNFWMLAS